MRSPYANIARVSCDICYMDILGRIIILALIFTQDPGSDQVQINNIKFWNSKLSVTIFSILYLYTIIIVYSMLNIAVLSSFVYRFQESFLFWRTTIENGKNHVSKKWLSPWPGFSADRSKIVRINFRVFTTCLNWWNSEICQNCILKKIANGKSQNKRTEVFSM